MVLGLVELALTSRRCADWDYAKRDGARSCWDRPGAGEGETEINSRVTRRSISAKRAMMRLWSQARYDENKIPLLRSQ